MALFRIYWVLFLVLLIGCEAVPPDAEIEFINANVVSEIEPNEIAYGCEYEDGSLCEDECCHTDDSCNGASYRKCDTYTGEWEGNYSDSSCMLTCEENLKAIDEQEKQRTKQLLAEFSRSIEQNAQEPCSEGWICLNSSWTAYQLEDCSLLFEAMCEKGCSGSKCNKICEEGALKCSGNKLMVCKDGYLWDRMSACEDGCEDSKCIVSSGGGGSGASQENSEQNPEPSPIMECANECISFLPQQSNFTGTVSCSNSIFLEVVTFENNCSNECLLTNWTLNDESNTTFTFPEFILGANSPVKIITGNGSSNSSDLYWDRCSAVWNNAGDTVFLRNRNNEIVVEYTYS